MEELKFVKTEEINPSKELKLSVGFKPKTPQYACAVVGILLILVNNTLSKVLGVFFILMSLAVVFLVKDYKVMDIYDEGVVVYADKNSSMGCFIKYDLVKEWGINREQGHDEITLTLLDNSRVSRNTFQASKIFKLLNTYMNEKESGYLKRKKQRETEFNYQDAVDNIKKKLFKK